jgi:hypothetical protein
MARPKHVVIDGKSYLWRDLLRLRREQTTPEPVQPALFELKKDARPASQRKADGRYQEPTLFKID